MKSFSFFLMFIAASAIFSKVLAGSTTVEICGKYNVTYVARSLNIERAWFSEATKLVWKDGVGTHQPVTNEVTISPGDRTVSEELYSLRNSILNIFESQKRYCISGVFSDQDQKTIIPYSVSNAHD